MPNMTHILPVPAYCVNLSHTQEEIHTIYLLTLFAYAVLVAEIVYLFLKKE